MHRVAAAKAGQNYDVKLEHEGRPLKLKDDGTSYAGVVASERKDAAEQWKWRFRYEGEDQIGYAATPLDAAIGYAICWEELTGGPVERWQKPPPHRTAYFSSTRSPGVVLRVS